jgi:hypothetical protein
MVVVLAGEEQLGALSPVLPLEARQVAVEFERELLVPGLVDERDELDEVVRPLRQVVPEGELGPQAVGLAEDALGRALVVPEARCLRQRVEFGETAFLDGEVKDAPMSPGSAQRDPGWLRDPPTP